jgi:hypothetical protein
VKLCGGDGLFMVVPFVAGDEYSVSVMVTVSMCPMVMSVIADRPRLVVFRRV